MTQKSYGIYSDEFRYLEIGDLLDALRTEGLLNVGQVYYECDVERVDIADYFSAVSLIDEAETRAYDDLGESADSALWVSEEATRELDGLIKAWVAKHLTGTFWRVVGKPRQLSVNPCDID